MASHLDLGKVGEDAAARIYAELGYRLVARNWRCRVGELDLIVRRGRTLVICEVKTRRGSRHGAAFEAVDARKQRKLRAVAEVFVQRFDLPAEDLRFDVASVRVDAGRSPQVELFEDAF